MTGQSDTDDRYEQARDDDQTTETYGRLHYSRALAGRRFFTTPSSFDEAGGFARGARTARLPLRVIPAVR